MEIYVKNASINFQCENDGKAIGVRLWGKKSRGKKNLVGERMENRRKIYFKPLLENSSFTRFYIIHLSFSSLESEGSDESGGLRLDLRFEMTGKKGRKFVHARKWREIEKAYATKKHSECACKIWLELTVDYWTTAQNVWTWTTSVFKSWSSIVLSQGGKGKVNKIFLYVWGVKGLKEAMFCRMRYFNCVYF